MEWLLERDEVAAVRHFPPRVGHVVDWPGWLPEECRESIGAAGVELPWSHQVEFADIAHRGGHAAICTPTGSGKSLAYLMPILAATTGQKRVVPEGSLVPRRPTALYISPTKALAHDQLRAARALAPRTWPVTTLDGDSDAAERKYARDHAAVVMTNPDMLHFSVLPGHGRWRRLLSGLSYVVIDEAHRYQGVFGAHVANVVRRLRRMCEAYGSRPVMLLSSATVPNAAQFGGALVGEDGLAVVSQSGAPAAARTVALWQPRGSLRHDTAELLASLSDEGRQTLAFVASRAGAELVSVAAQETAGHPERIASYRGGYLAMERRALEAALHSGAIAGLATTNALELGVDVSGIDAVLVSGYPGRLSSFWQQAGRAGRAGQEAHVVMLASENPLDAYLVTHPELLLDAPVERAVLHPTNPHVLGPHLAAAAQEQPLVETDARWFGPETVALARHLARSGVLRDRGDRWYWTRPDRAVDFINLRSSSPAPIEIIELGTGRVLGVVDQEAADRTVHPGAVYLHQGESWLVDQLDRDENQALVRAARPRYYTQAQSTFDIEVVRELRSKTLGATRVHLGDVRLASRVTGYLRRDEVTHEILDSTPLEMPERVLHTQAVWLTVPEDIQRELRWAPLRMGAAAHAAEHTAIGLLPVFAPCDRWDIGGVSTAFHEHTDAPTIFVHDGLSGGSGFAERGFEVADMWLAATLERLSTCDCDAGCPACVVSPKCGNENQVLDKHAATQLLGLLLSGFPQD